MDEVREWLQKARNDLLSARILMEHEPPVLDTAAFHCQQTVEKALKAFLVWKVITFEKVHSLTYLLDLCEGQEPKFASMREMAETLAPFAVQIRYPGEELDISPEEASDVLATAETVWKFVLDLLPVELSSTVAGRGKDYRPESSKPSSSGLELA